MQKGKFLTEHLILSVCPDILPSRTPQFPRQKHTLEHLFYRTALSGCFQMSVIFSEMEKQYQFYMSPLYLYDWNLIFASKLKAFSFTNQLNCFNVRCEKSLYVCLFFMFTFSCKFVQTSLIIKELIKHENKLNRKVFYDRENFENRFSEFSDFMKDLRILG